MMAILGGLGAALMWGAATVCSARSSTIIGAASTLAWVMLVGLAVALTAVAVSGAPSGLTHASIGWLFVAGIGNVLGLLLEYSGLRVGKVGIVASIASTEGAIAAVLAIVAGERVSPGTVVLLALIAGGIFLASRVGDAGEDSSTRVARDSRRSSLLAMAAAMAFGVGLYATGRVSADLTISWVILPSRLIGVVAVASPLAMTRRLRLTGRAAPLILASGLCEVRGFASFAIGARHGIAVSAVLGSQFAAVAAVTAYVLFKERLARVQLVGVATILLGVAVLTGLRVA